MCQREQKVDKLTKAMPAVSLKKCESWWGIEIDMDIIHAYIDVL